MYFVYVFPHTLYLLVISLIREKFEDFYMKFVSLPYMNINIFIDMFINIYLFFI